MKLSYCDICQVLIKNGDKKYLFGINQVTEKSTEEDFENLSQDELKKVIQNYQSEYKSIKIFEICKDCKDVIQKVLMLRKTEIQKLKEDLEKIWNSSEHNT